MEDGMDDGMTERSEDEGSAGAEAVDAAAGEPGEPGDTGLGEAHTLEDRLRRLDRIVAELEGGEVPLEQGLALFEEGVGHIREAEALLARAELRVEELVGEGEAARTRPFEGEAEG